MFPQPVSSLELFGDQGKDTKPFAYFEKDDEEEEEDGSCRFSRNKIFVLNYHTMSCFRQDGYLRMWYPQISVDHHPHDDDGGGSGECYVESDENDDESYVYVGDENVQSLPEEQEWW